MCQVIFDTISNRNFKMPKVKTPFRSRLQIYVKEHNDIFNTDGSILCYNICEIPIDATTKFLVNQHLSHDKRENNLKLKESNLKMTKPSFISNMNVNNFNEDICQDFIAANILLFKLHIPSFRAFFFIKCIERHISDELTIQKKMT